MTQRPQLPAIPPDSPAASDRWVPASQELARELSWLSHPAFARYLDAPPREPRRGE